MSLKESLDIPLGSGMSPFTLNDSSGTRHNSDDLFGNKGLLVVFTCNHCPYAQAIWPRLVQLCAHAEKLGVRTVAINPNIHPDYPQDSPEEMQKNIKRLGIKFPYLVDETQQVAKQFKAQCTPDIYLYDKQKKLVYHGRLDDNWQDESKVKRHELKEAIGLLTDGKEIFKQQYPTIGCSIKWRL